jgi:hypothetical protein
MLKKQLEAARAPAVARKQAIRYLTIYALGGLKQWT